MVVSSSTGLKPYYAHQDRCAAAAVRARILLSNQGTAVCGRALIGPAAFDLDAQLRMQREAAP